MTKNDVINLIATVLECKTSELNGKSGLGRHPKWDSLGHVGIMAALEETFNVPVSDATIGCLTTIDKIADYVERRA